MALAPVQQLMTADEFESFADSEENADRLLELIEGEIVEKMPTYEHGFINVVLSTKLWNFVEPRHLGRVASEVRFRKPEDRYNSRIPDVAFSSARIPLTRRGSTPVFPDLAFEIKSPDDSLMKLRAKARFYLANGVKIVWLIIPELKLVEVYTANEESILTENDTLSGGDVLPGFMLPVRDIFIDPFAEAAEAHGE